MEQTRRAGRSTAWVWVACGAGLVHAGFSLFWALGGRALLDTVGSWAVRLAVESPVLAGLGLGLVAVVKATAAIVPVAVARGRLGHGRFWRAVSWAGGLLLIVYGGANTVVSNAVLAGLIRPEGGHDRAAMIGHAWLWDPLFLLWGVALTAHLWCSRPRTAGHGAGHGRLDPAARQRGA